jgi:RHS repeat-associated protein
MDGLRPSTTGAGDDLDYMHARHYSPVTGRFLSVDSAPGLPEVPQAWNRYLYVLANPLRYKDPDGESAISALSELYSAAASNISAIGSSVQAFGDSLNNGSILGIVADTALGTAGSLAQGYGDMLNLGIATGQAVGSDADAFAIAEAIAVDVGRASGIALTVAGAGQIRGVGRISAEAQAKNLARFERKLPAGAGQVQVRSLPDGGQIFRAEVPGKVPGSKAVYEKRVDASGKTTGFTKTTIDPQGKVVHTKDKLRPRVWSAYVDGWYCLPDELVEFANLAFKGLAVAPIWARKIALGLRNGTSYAHACSFLW